MRPACLLAIFLAIVGCHKGEPKNPAPTPGQTTTSTVTIGKDGDAQFPVVDNGRFYVVPDYHLDSDKAVNLTLEEHIVTQVRTDRECCSAEITAKGAINDKPTWTMRKKASEAGMFDRFYRTVTYGCCGSATRYAYFDPLTGNQSFIATEPIASLGVANGGYELSRYLALNRINEPGDDELVLQIQYGTQSAPSLVLFLVCPGQDIATLSTTVEYLRDGKREGSTTSGQDGIFPRDYTLFPPGYPSNPPATANDISGFSFLLKIEGQPPIKFPVVKDRLDFSQAALPKGCHISLPVPPHYSAYLRDMSEYKLEQAGPALPHHPFPD
jgi:hypothetical protein